VVVSEDGTAGRTGMRSRALVGIVALVLVMAIVTSIVLYSAARVEWKTVRIDRTDAPVYWPYVATDDAGTLHMTYYVNHRLIHSTLTDEGWEHSNVTEASIWGTSPIMFESDGTPHICYQVEDASSASGNCILRHARMVDSEWWLSTVSNTSVKGSHSMALDVSGNAHIAFIQSGGFVYANHTSGLWQRTYLLEQPISSDNYGMTSIAIDASGHPHVAVGYNQGFVGVFSEVGDSWNLTNLFNWDMTRNSVSIDIGEDSTIVVCYWGYPAGELVNHGVMLASKGPGGWAVETVYTPQSYTNEFLCSISVADGGIVKIAVERDGDSGRSLAVITSSEGGWEYSEVIESYDHPAYSMWQSHLSICSDEDGHTIVSVNRGAAEYATNSLDQSDRLSAVYFIALAGYTIGFVVWVIVLGIVRVLSNRAWNDVRDR
jgi:hypothetical protein